ncbi:MAG: M16 family metallopeptidase [Holophagaceae bacterium]|jgi:predicted Zn-dependent peptidase
MVNTFVLSLISLSLVAQTPSASQGKMVRIPSRPETLSFRPIDFKVPNIREARTKLSNGISCYLVPDQMGQPIININITLKGGGYLDPQGKEGLAQIMGGLLRTGGTSRLTPSQLDERLEFIAAQANASLGDTSGQISMSVLSKDVQEGVSILMDMLTQPRFDSDRFELVKKNTLQAMQRRNDDTTSIERQQLGFLLRGEDYYGNRNATKASIDSITLEDIRTAHAQLIHPSNMIVSVSGKFDKTEILTLLNDTLGKLTESSTARISPEVPEGNYIGKPGIFVVDKDVNQGRVTINLPGVAAISEDYPSVLVMNSILGGGGFTSRLVKKIRSDEGLAYSAGSTFTSSVYVNRAGDFRALFQTKTRTVAYGTKLALAEIQKIRTELISAEELSVAKGSIIDGFPAQFANKSTIAGAFSSGEFSKRPDTWLETLRDRVNKVTREDVLRVAQKYLQLEKASILVVGNAKEMEEGDPKDHPGKLSEVGKFFGFNWSMVNLPLRDPMTMKPIK